MKLSAKAVANYFLQKHPKEISHLKLQKLVYISHGWHLCIFDKPLVEDEFAEAWKYGPVFNSLYDEFKIFGSKPIDKLATEFSDDMQIFKPFINPNHNETIQLLDEVWDNYGKFTAVELSEMTHQDNTPWHKIWSANPGIRNLNMSNDVIKEHYKELKESLENNG